MVKDLDQRSTTTDQGPTTQEMTYDLRSVLGFCLFVLCLLSGKKNFYPAFLQRFLVQCKTFMTGIKLGKLDFI